ncbi:MAG: DNA polymerase III subunit delta [Rhodospirillaceae bacterium]|nr:DNA polymerase III subunit delta [Rhodospirillaceae bacterium]
MKITPARAESFLAKPGDVRAILLYGPDAGLVRERMNALTKTVAGSVDDPFRVTEFAASVLRDTPGRLGDEAAALSFTGGRRVVRCRDADGDARLETTVANVFEAYFEHGVGEALVIVTAGNVGGRSKLVQVFEAANGGAAVACYADEGQTLDRVIRETLKASGLTATPDALAWLSDRLGGDRELSRRELEKLAMYMGGPGDTPRNVTEDDARACIGDTAALELDDLIYAMGDGDQATVQRVYGRMMDEGASPIMVLGAAARHLLRLHETRGRMNDGKSLDQALMALRPPPFFKVKARFQHQASTWSEALIARGLDLLNEAEMRAKSTDMPAEAVAERALMQITQAAKGARRAR